MSAITLPQISIGAAAEHHGQDKLVAVWASNSPQAISLCMLTVLEKSSEECRSRYPAFARRYPRRFVAYTDAFPFANSSRGNDRALQR
jgi:hypothetical protein